MTHEPLNLFNGVKAQTGGEPTVSPTAGCLFQASRGINLTVEAAGRARNGGKAGDSNHHDHVVVSTTYSRRNPATLALYLCRATARYRHSGSVAFSGPVMNR